MQFSSFTESYRNWRQYRKTVGELSRLSRRELDDLGIAPYDIESIARSSSRG
ncbi:MAG: DUF1127 domain-containing protein [Hyphomicrobiales bacterium]